MLTPEFDEKLTTKQNYAKFIMWSVQNNGVLQRSIFDLIVDSISFDDLIREMYDLGYIELDLDEDGEMIIIKSRKIFRSNELFKSANAVFINSTNKHINDKYSGRVGEIYFTNGILFFLGRYFEPIFRTSTIKNYKLENKKLTLHTLNSVYVFKLLKNIDIDDNILYKK
ncbi:MAG: hypothetical protein QM497_03345 [Sulfurimonas sp.]